MEVFSMMKYEQVIGSPITPEQSTGYVSPDYPKINGDVVSPFGSFGYNDPYDQNSYNQQPVQQPVHQPVQPQPVNYMGQPFAFNPPQKAQCIRMDESNVNIEGLVAIMALDDRMFKSGTSVRIKINRSNNKPIASMNVMFPHIPVDNGFADEFMGIVQDCDPTYMTIFTVSREGCIKCGYVSIYDIIDGVVSVRVVTMEEPKVIKEEKKEESIVIPTVQETVEATPIPQPEVVEERPMTQETRPITINPTMIPNTQSKPIPTSEEIVNIMMSKAKAILN